MIEQYDIITLSNNKDYTVAEKTFLNDREYFLLIEVDKDENLLDDKLIVEKYQTDNGYSVRLIEDKETFKQVKDIFINLLYNE